eukprot:m.951177 g.951177  ORF g.951177 m.951177 type:complete len:515 (+) comp23864_c0_seq4:1674-3218(+)
MDHTHRHTHTYTRTMSHTYCKHIPCLTHARNTWKHPHTHTHIRRERVGDHIREEPRNVPDHNCVAGSIGASDRVDEESGDGVWRAVPPSVPISDPLVDSGDALLLREYVCSRCRQPCGILVFGAVSRGPRAPDAAAGDGDVSSVDAATTFCACSGVSTPVSTSVCRCGGTARGVGGGAGVEDCAEGSSTGALLAAGAGDEPGSGVTVADVVGDRAPMGSTADAGRGRRRLWGLPEGDVGVNSHDDRVDAGTLELKSPDLWRRWWLSVCSTCVDVCVAAACGCSAAGGDACVESTRSADVAACARGASPQDAAPGCTGSAAPPDVDASGCADVGVAAAGGVALGTGLAACAASEVLSAALSPPPLWSRDRHVGVSFGSCAIEAKKSRTNSSASKGALPVLASCPPNPKKSSSKSPSISRYLSRPSSPCPCNPSLACRSGVVPPFPRALSIVVVLLLLPDLSGCKSCSASGAYVKLELCVDGDAASLTFNSRSRFVWRIRARRSAGDIPALEGVFD